MDDVLVALRMIVALAAVLGLLLFLSRRLQKAGSKGGNPLDGLLPKKLGRLSVLRPLRSASTKSARTRPEKITVVARTSIGAKAQLVVAEFGGIRYVLGVTEGGVSVVDTQESPAQVDDADDDIDAANDDDVERPPLTSVA